MGAMVSQLTSLTIVYSTVYSCADQTKHQSSASLAFVGWIHRWLANSPHKWPVTRKMFPFDDVIMWTKWRCIFRFPHNNSACRGFGSLQWRHNERDGVSNHRRLDCLLNHLFAYCPLWFLKGLSKYQRLPEFVAIHALEHVQIRHMLHWATCITACYRDVS